MASEPQVYQATYSGVAVFELPAKNVAVMKRQKDGWVNATHILKVANFDKPQRTRILERQVQRGTHEKIQGGYGKYQGTWVPLERAREIAEQYEVIDLLDPLFSYSPGEGSTPFAPRHSWKSRSTNGTKKETAAAAAAAAAAVVSVPVVRRSGRQSSHVDGDGGDGEVDGDGDGGSGLGNSLKRNRVLSTGTKDNQMLAPPATKKRRGRPPLAKKIDSLTSPVTRKYPYGLPPSTPKQKSSSLQNNGSMSVGSSSVSSRSSSPSDFMSESDIDAALTSNNLSTPISNAARNAIIASSKHRRTPSMITDSPQFYNGYDRYGRYETPKKEHEGRGEQDHQVQGQGQGQGQAQGLGQQYQLLQTPQQGHSQLHIQSPSLHSRTPSQIQSNLSYPSRSSRPSQSQSQPPLSTIYSNKLLDYFTSIDNAEIPEFLINPPTDFKINQIIDDEGHTAFHWACSMGDLKIIEVLLKAGADISATNYSEQTPLIRSILFTNNYDRRTFPKVVDLLRETILYVDSHKQTVLHHIASTTSSRSKLSSTRYYTEIILAKLLEIKSLSVVTDFVNVQDENGDTALHIAARNGARKCVKVLIHYNARTDIVNNNGRTTQEYISEYEAQRQQLLKQSDNLAHIKSSSSPMSNGNGYNFVMPGQTEQHQQHQQQQQRQQSNQEQSQSQSKSEHQQNSQPPISTPNGNVYTSIGNPHASEVAIRATQRVTPLIIESIEELAVAYDAELHEKDSDVEQVRHLLETMKQDITDTENSINEIQELSGDESTIKSRLQQANDLVNSKALQLRTLLERSQSRDLAMLVQIEEDRVSNELQKRNESDKEHIISLASILIDLQESRVKLVNEIVELCASAGAGEKMNDYRKLVSLSCGVKIEEIDNLLDGIAQALLSDNSSDDFQRND